MLAVAPRNSTRIGRLLFSGCSPEAVEAALFAGEVREDVAWAALIVLVERGEGPYGRLDTNSPHGLQTMRRVFASVRAGTVDQALS